MTDIGKDLQNAFNDGYTQGKADANHWISCTERLPEKSGRYLATRGLKAAGSLWNRVYIVNYSDLMGLKKQKIFWVGNVGKSDFERIEDVIAWKTLPEPYKGKDGGGA